MTKIKKGQRLSGTYSNGVETWDFSGTVSEIHNDTAGGNFGVARIRLDKQFNGRQNILMTLDEYGYQADSRYDV